MTRRNRSNGEPDRDLAALRAGIDLWRGRAEAAAADPCSEHRIEIDALCARLAATQAELERSAAGTRTQRARKVDMRQSRDAWKRRAELAETQPQIVHHCWGALRSAVAVASKYTMHQGHPVSVDLPEECPACALSEVRALLNLLAPVVPA